MNDNEIAQRLEKIYAYQAVELPGYGPVKGDWDFRETAAEYLGNVKFEGKKVLEIGPANGFFTRYIEESGADVTAFDLSEKDSVDHIPYAGKDLSIEIRLFKKLVGELNNGWWLLHDLAGLKAKFVTGSVYDINSEVGVFDISVVGAVLLTCAIPY